MRKLIIYLPIIVLLTLIGCDHESVKRRFETWAANHLEFKVVDWSCEDTGFVQRCEMFLATPEGLQEVYLRCPVGGCRIDGVRGK